jgi:hypothetical protein
MPATRVFIPRDDAPTAPCEKGCRLWDVCDYFELACMEFLRFVNHGANFAPPKMNGELKATREIYREVFQEDDEGSKR